MASKKDKQILSRIPVGLHKFLKKDADREDRTFNNNLVRILEGYRSQMEGKTMTASSGVGVTIPTP